MHRGNALVHVSGHAAAGELRYLYNIVKPRHVMPVHGEWRHLRANAGLAQQVGIPEDRILLADDGVTIDLADGKAEISGYIPVGHIYVDGSSVGDVTETLLKDRRILGEEGFISIFCAVDLVRAEVVVGPEIHARGLGLDDAAYEPVVAAVHRAVQEALQDGASDTYALQQVIRRQVGRWVSTTHRRRPMIVPVVVEA